MDSLLHGHLQLPALVQIPGGLLAGAILGFLHFMTLRWNAGYYLQNRHGRALLVQLCRFIVLFVVLFVLAKAGALALISALVAILGARAVVLRVQGRDA